jgi:protein phosphatase
MRAQAARRERTERMRVQSAAMSDVGLVRSSNQDYVGCFPERGLFIVADGMGGHADGEIAARLAVEKIPSSLPPMTSSAERAQQIADAIRHANAQIFTAGRGGPRGDLPMGTTVVVLEVGAAAAWAHVGDSRLYRLRDGSLSLLTADHTHYGMRIAPGDEIPLDLPHTNQLIAALGVEPTVRVSTGAAEIRDGDVFLLCSDGVSGAIPHDEIRIALAVPKEPLEIVTDLLARSQVAGGIDNASAIVVQVGLD